MGVRGRENDFCLGGTFHMLSCALLEFIINTMLDK